VPWEERFEQLRAYHEVHGHTRVRQGEDYKLAGWVKAQRDRYRRGELKEDRWRKLASLDFVFDTVLQRPKGLVQVPWEERFEQLRAYHVKHGHTRVSLSEDLKLARWVQNQRTKHEHGRLSEDQIEMLAAIDFDFEKTAWSRRAEKVRWERNHERLKAYHAEHGHVRVSKREDQKLYYWLGHQRYAHQCGELRPECREKLESLGFDFSPHQSVPWEERFDELQAYHAEHGHTRVSEREDQKLAKWVRDQRRKHRLGKLRPERREKLESLGFDFSPQSVPWEERFDELEAYHSEHGHTRVSNREDLKLAKWVWQQRYAHKRGMLRPEHREKLESLGFDFSPQLMPWEERFDELETYHAEHGHIQVSEREDLKLAKWVRKQREQHRLGKLRPERREKLESLGFDFSPQRIGRRRHSLANE
jgi:aromatic ring-cleaving dioxygenase